MSDAAHAIESLDIDAVGDDVLAARHQLEMVLDLEAVPDVPVMPVAEGVAELRHASPLVRRQHWVVWDDDRTRILAGASVAWEDVDDNRHIAFGNISVDPDIRRKGVGRRLLSLMADAADDDGRSLLWLDARTEGPQAEATEAFLTAHGFENRQIGRRSQLRTDQVDRPLLQEWVDRAAERAEGYSLVSWERHCPDDLIDAFVHAKHVMNTAPKDDLDFDDEVFTVERWRAREAVIEERGHEMWTLAARNDESGDLAGYTEIEHLSHWAQMAFQQDTGVWPSHRNKGLGRWLKAAMLQRVLVERPRVERVETWNAGSNDAMLGINVAMGFEVVDWWGEWQGTTDQIRKAIAS